MFSLLFRHIFALLPVHEAPVRLRRWYLAAPSDESRARSNSSNSYLRSGWYTTLEALVYAAPNHKPMTTYLEQRFALQFQEHESSMRYGGGYYLAGHNQAANVHVTVVAAHWLGWQIPKLYRTESWYYVSVTCTETDADTSLFEGYQAIDASRYHIA
jgi:hypothetical protein